MNIDDGKTSGDVGAWFFIAIFFWYYIDRSQIFCEQILQKLCNDEQISIKELKFILAHKDKFPSDLNIKIAPKDRQKAQKILALHRRNIAINRMLNPLFWIKYVYKKLKNLIPTQRNNI